MGKILIINEKPDQSKKFVQALQKEGKFSKNNGYFESDSYVIAFAFGHLLNSKQPQDYEEFGGWKWSAVPFFPPNGGLDYHVSEKSKAPQLKVIGDLLKRKDIDFVINGTDAGREGELIFWEVYDYFKSSIPVKRLWISSLVEKDILDGIKNLKDEKFFLPKRAAAYSRQYADWLLGMNLTVGFSIKANMGRALHFGRVQTPTLAILVNRKQEIENFKSENYFELEVDFGEKYKAKWFKEQLGNTKFEKREVVEDIVNKIKGKSGEVTKKDVEEEKENPKTLYNLADLQRDCNKKFGFTAKKTLDIAQLLYEKYTVLSYPRTDSRHLGTVMIPELQPTLEAIAVGDYEKFVDEILSRGIKTSKQFIDDTKVSDHHALMPTSETPDTSKFVDEAKSGVKRDDLIKVYDLVVKRFLSVFYPAALYEKTEIVTEVEGETFKTSGKILVSSGWKEVYGSEVSDDEDEDEAPKKGGKGSEKVKVVKLPPIEKGEVNAVNEIDLQEKQTKPPSHYTEGGLIGIMENPRRLLEDDDLKEAMKEARAGLGTQATRQDIIENIINRKYVERKGKKLIATELAEKLISIAPEGLKSPTITAEWEQKLMDMEKDKIKQDEFEKEIKDYVTNSLDDLKNLELSISFGHVNDKEAIGVCPNCKGNVFERKSVYACETQNCFVIFKEIAKKKISLAQAKQLLTKGETAELKGFKSSKGSSFNAKLIIKEGKVSFGFEEQKVEKTDLKCPDCNSFMLDKGKVVSCENSTRENPHLTIFKTIASKKLTMKQIEKLVNTGETDAIEGFKSSKGKPFNAKLKLEKNKVSFVFENNNESKQTSIECPFCGGNVKENTKAYGCSNWKEKNCKFTVWKTMMNRKISIDEVKELVVEGRTQTLDGFKNGKGKEFKASLVINKEEKKIDLSFD